MTISPWQIAILLPRFYTKNALAIGGLSDGFKITSFKFGHDPSLIDDSASPPNLLAFDPAQNDIENAFYEGTMSINDVVYSDGRLLFRCTMPQNTLTEPKQYSQTGLYDQDGDLVAVSIDLPDWITPTEEINTNPYINFPVTAEDA